MPERRLQSHGTGWLAGVEVRYSKDPDGPTLEFTKTELGAWLDGAKNGDFDGLV